MLPFRHFITEISNQPYHVPYNNLIEELSSAQKKFVDDNFEKTGKAENISGHVIPKGQDRISIPLEGSGSKKTATPHPDVVSHLKKHGYSVDDYIAGTARKEGDKRIFKIGRVLNSTNAPKEIHNTFQNDPARAASKSGAAGLHVVISRHPHDVAGMSTNQGWASCMTMKGDDSYSCGGSNQHYLKHDVEQGTHVAYLAHKDDPEAKKPLARIALKPYEPVDKSKKTILRPEGRTYGTADSSFDKTVSNWAKTNFPADPSTDYNKNKKLYHDSGSRVILGKAGLESRKNESQIKKYFQHSDEVTPEEINKGLDHPNKDIRKLASRHVNRSPENVTKALNDPDHFVRAYAVQPLAGNRAHPSVTKEHLDKAVDDRSATVRSTAVEHPNLTNEHIRKLVYDKNGYIARSALQRADSDTIHSYIDKQLKSKSPDVNDALFSLNINTDHINKIVNSGKPRPIEDVARKASYAKDIKNVLPHNFHDSLASHHDPAIRRIAAQYGEQRHMDALVHDTDGEVRATAIKNTNNQSHIDNALTDSHPAVRTAALRNTSKVEHLSKVLRDKNSSDEDVYQALHNKHVKTEDLQHVADHRDFNKYGYIAKNIINRRNKEASTKE